MPHEEHPNAGQEPIPPTQEQASQDHPASLEGILAARGLGVVKFTHDNNRAVGYTQSYDQLALPGRETSPGGMSAGQLKPEDAAHMEANHMDALHDTHEARGERDGVRYTTQDGAFVPGQDVLSSRTDAPRLAHSKEGVRISPRSTNADYTPRREQRIKDAVNDTIAVEALKNFVGRFGRKGGGH